MKDNVKKILEDIYSIDASLKQNEESLIKIIEELLVSKPESKIDENFISQLRIKLLSDAGSPLAADRKKYSLATMWIFKRLAIGGFSLAIIFMAAFLIGLQRNFGEQKPAANSTLAVTNVGGRAFGDIVFSAQSQSEASSVSADVDNKNAVAEAQPLSVSSSETAPAGLGGGGGVAGMPAIVMPQNYNYVYKGGGFQVASDGLVYKLATGNSFGSQLANVVKNMNLGVNLSNFANLKIDSLQFSEDKQFGYSLYIDLNGNNFSINMNWQKWPQVESKNLVQLPPNSQIIAISDKFLSEYGIDMSNYGPGEVMKNQAMIMGAKAAPAASSDAIAGPIYSPYVSVVYPLIIDGKEVYSQGGGKYGLTVGIDLGYGRVTSVYNISTGSLESSKYDVITDTDKLTKMAENGGLSGYYYYPNGQKNQEIDLGTPKQALVVMWKTEQGQNSYQLFVPALVFPITSDLSQSYYYRQNVIVPLVGGVQDNVPQPMPLLESTPSK